MKVCNRCKKELPKTEFHKDRNKKDGLSTLCKQCRRQWAIENKELRREYSRKYSQENKEWEKERRRRARKANPELYRESFRRWKENNPEKMKAHKKRDYEKNSEAYKMRSLKYRQQRKQQGMFEFSIEDWREILKEFNNKCAYCGANGEEGLRKGLQLEHVVPITAGGTYEKSNIVPACPSCNLSKHNKSLQEWYPTKPFYNEEKMKYILQRLSANQR